MSKARTHKKKHQEPPAPIEYVIQQQPKFNITNKNTGTATFSNMAKQAETLVNGEMSILFNNYNNNVVFRSSRIDMNDCLNIDVAHQALQNVNNITFTNNTTVAGISDGYTVNAQGIRVPMYDNKIALSTVFGYEYTHTISAIKRDLNNEIEHRKYEDALLNKRCDDIVSDITDINTALSEMRADIDTIKNKCEEYDRRISANENKINEYETRISANENKINEYEKRIATVEEKSAKSETRIKQLESLTRHFVM